MIRMETILGEFFMKRVFISYSHRDEELRERLEVHLAPLKNKGTIKVWHDRFMLPGDQLNDQTLSQLCSADVILLLVSADFLASDYCSRIEQGAALKRHKSGQCRAITVVLRPCGWQETELGNYLVTPTDGKAVSRWESEDEALQDVVKSIQYAIKADTMVATAREEPDAQSDVDWAEVQQGTPPPKKKWVRFSDHTR